MIAYKREMSSELLDIQPRELKFIFELKKQSSCSVRLVNKTNSFVAFKVKTTSPKKYCVRPNVGIVKPKSSCDFTVTMQAQRVVPPDLICKDKFLVQSTVVPEGTTDEDIVSSMFSKDNGKFVEENKLKVVLVSPPHSPVLSPINGVHKQMSDHEPALLNDQVFNSIQFLMPHKKKSVEEINLQKSDSIEETTPPNRSSEDISFKSNETSENVALPNKVQGKGISPQNNKDSEVINLSTVQHIEEFSSQKNDIIKGCTSPKNDESEDIKKNESLKYISPQKNEIIEDIGPQKRDTIEAFSLLNNNNGKFISPQNKVVQDTKESFTVDSELAGSESIKVGRMKGMENIEVDKDTKEMTSKLSELQLKLNEAQMMISELTEERRLNTLERESLQKELAVLKSRPGTRSVQVGFPFLFVVMVALVSVVLGYLCRC